MGKFHADAEIPEISAEAARKVGFWKGCGQHQREFGGRDCRESLQDVKIPDREIPRTVRTDICPSPSNRLGLTHSSQRREITQSQGGRQVFMIGIPLILFGSFESPRSCSVNQNRRCFFLPASLNSLQSVFDDRLLRQSSSPAVRKVNT